jgi:hypothetical protein
MVTLLLVLTCFGAQEQRLAVPSAADQKKAEAEIRSVFKDDFAKKDRDSRRSLAQKLLGQAADTKNTPASRYAVLFLARDLAAEALDIDTIFASIEQLEKLYEVGKPPLSGASFTVDLNAQKIFALNGAKKFATTPADAVALSGAYLRVAEEALKQKTLDDAFAAAQAAEQYARSAKSTPGLARASQLVRELPELKREDEQFGKIVSSGSDDAAAKLVKGRYSLFVVGDEKAGIQNLLECSDDGLKNVAKLENARPAEAEGRFDLAEAWYALAKKEESALQKRRYQDRARIWVEEALKVAGGIIRAKIEKRVKELDPQPLTTSQVDLLKSLDPAKDGVAGTWKLENGVLISPQERFARIQIPYLPPEEYDLKIVGERKSRSGAGGLYVGLVHGERQVGAEVDSGGEMTRLLLIDGKMMESFPGVDSNKGSRFEDGRTHTMLYKIRNNRVQVLVDDKLVVDWAADYGKISVHSSWRAKDPRQLLLGGHEATFHIRQILLTNVTGTGKAAR